jgi:parallel beta-helix repeat protein
MKRNLLFLLLVTALLIAANPAQGDFYVIAGGGAVGTKIKSLPYTISQPGFYYLDHNLTSTSDGIFVETDGVTIDLMGFQITGPRDATSSVGVQMIGSVENVEIRNGTVTGFTHGIIDTVLGEGKYRIINVRAIGNAQFGIILGNSGNIVKGCTASGNGSGGIYCRDSLVINNIAINNGLSGNINATGTVVENYAL